jgi:hypothetical protein
MMGIWGGVSAGKGRWGGEGETHHCEDLEDPPETEEHAEQHLGDVVLSTTDIVEVW